MTIVAKKIRKFQVRLVTTKNLYTQLQITKKLEHFEVGQHFRDSLPESLVPKISILGQNPWTLPLTNLYRDFDQNPKTLR